MRRLLLLLVSCAAVLPAQQEKAPQPPAGPPLAQYTAVKVAMAPVQFYRGDSAVVHTPAMAMRAAFDSLLTVQLEEHGLGATWASPADVIRTAKRNSMYTADPRNLGAFPVRQGVPREGVIPDPLAGNLRRLVALHDTRYALLPVELQVGATPAGVRAGVRLVLVDARTMRALYQVELATDAAPAYSPALLQQMAARVVELAVAP